MKPTPYIKYFQLLHAVEKYGEDFNDRQALDRLEQACISFVADRYGVSVTVLPNKW